MHHFGNRTGEARSVTEIMQVMIPDLFERSRSVARADSIAAMEREIPKICAILDLDPKTMKPKVTPPTALKTRLELMERCGL